METLVDGLVHVRLNDAVFDISLGDVPAHMHDWLAALLAQGDSDAGTYLMHKGLSAALIAGMGSLRGKVNATRVAPGVGPFAAMPELGKMPKHTDSLAFVLHWFLDALHGVLCNGEWWVDVSIGAGEDGRIVVGVNSLEWRPADLAALEAPVVESAVPGSERVGFLAEPVSRG